MKKILVILFLFKSFLGFGQQVNAPDPKEFTINTSAQNASGFSLSGFNSSDILLCAIGLPVAPNGTTFYITTTTGLTASIGYTLIDLSLNWYVQLGYSLLFCQHIRSLHIHR